MGGQRKNTPDQGEERGRRKEAETPPKGAFGTVDGLLRGLGNLIADLEDSGTVRRAGEVQLRKKAIRVRYDCSIGTLTDREPTKQRASTVGIREAKEALVDVFEVGGHVVVVAELPDVEQTGDIKLRVTHDQLAILADTPRGRLRRDVPLPAPVEHEPMEVLYKNGVLNAKFRKKGALR